MMFVKGVLVVWRLQKESILDENNCCRSNSEVVVVVGVVECGRCETAAE
jgi:hypothetical protein